MSQKKRAHYTCVVCKRPFGTRSELLEHERKVVVSFLNLPERPSGEIALDLESQRPVFEGSAL